MTHRTAREVMTAGVMSGARSADTTGEAAPGRVRPGGGTILDAIGNTPLVMVDGIWVKLEYLNPSGSIKARIAKYIIERAEREGLLRPGDTIVEASSGNTGNAMSMVAAVKGYRMLVVMPNGMSAERLKVVREGGHFVAVYPGVDEQHAGPAVHDNGVALAEIALVGQHTLRDLPQHGIPSRSRA